MDSIHLDNLDNRTPQYTRNAKLEQLLTELKSLLEPVDGQVSQKFDRPQWPPLFLVGSPRSGTTFIYQLLNATGQFAVPTNLLSRFYYAPYLGAKIQQLLTDKTYDYGDEMGDYGGHEPFKSNLGKTLGPLAPSEFTHFWRRFIPNYDPQYLSPSEESLIDGAGLCSGLAAIESVMQRPLALKAFIIQYNLPKLHEILEGGIFLRLHRDVTYIMQSLYEARLAFYKTLDIWWSVKPREYSELKLMDPYRQIAGQVFFTEQALERGMAKIPPEIQLSVQYEEVCQDPMGFYRQVKEKYRNAGLELPSEVVLPTAFSPANKNRIPDAELQKLVDAYDSFSESSMMAREN
jgi:hypothetical protein